METFFSTNKTLLYIPLVSCLLRILALLHLELSHGEGISIPESHAEKRGTFDLRVSEFIKMTGPWLRKQKKNDATTYAQAIEDWERDLKYLKKTYYDKHFHFVWPDTAI